MNPKSETERQRDALPWLNTVFRQFEANHKCCLTTHIEELAQCSSWREGLILEAGWRPGLHLVSSDSGLSAEILILALSPTSWVTVGKSLSLSLIFSTHKRGILIIVATSVSQNCCESLLGQHM